MGNLSFNAKKVAPGGEFEPLAAGEYHLAVLKSELVQNKASEGSHVLLTLQVQDGPHRGRLVWERCTWTNPSEEAVRIGHERLSAYCHATGLVKAIKDTSELHGIPFRARLGIEEARNVVHAGVVEGWTGGSRGTSSAAAAGCRRGRGGRGVMSNHPMDDLITPPDVDGGTTSDRYLMPFGQARGRVLGRRARGLPLVAVRPETGRTSTRRFGGTSRRSRTSWRRRRHENPHLPNRPRGLHPHRLRGPSPGRASRPAATRRAATRRSTRTNCWSGPTQSCKHRWVWEPDPEEERMAAAYRQIFWKDY